MKISGIATLLICGLFVGIFTRLSAISYLDARKKFEKNICAFKGDRMKDEQYLQLMRPHIEKAEKELHILKYMQQKEALDKDEENYFIKIAKMNSFIFNYCASPKDPLIKSDLERCKSDVLHVIQNIQTKSEIDIDVNVELNRTIELLTDANREFYDQLGFYEKIASTIIFRY